MIRLYSRYALSILLSLCATVKSVAEESPKICTLAIGLENELKDLVILDNDLQSSGQISLRKFAFSNTFTCPIVKKELLFGIPDGKDEAGNPQFKQIASFAWKNSYDQVCLIFVPKSLNAPENQSTAEYTIQPLVLDSDSFALGHIKIINLTSMDTIVRAGEHQTTIAAWDRAECSSVTETDSMNMAPIQVSYLVDGTEYNAYQSRTRFLDRIRYTVFIYPDTENEKTSVRIVKDFGNLFK